MKVKDLIEWLSKQDKDADLWIYHDEWCEYWLMREGDIAVKCNNEIIGCK